MARKQRLDVVLVERGLASSRQQAQQWIRAGRVRSQGQVLDKPGHATAADLPLEVDQPPPFVSRGGEKLVAALDALPIRVAGRVCLDGGISTGGFSDCLLQRGASRVYGIDVGYGQTAWSLRTDPRLVLRERTNLRHLSPDDLYGPGDPWPDLAVADLSFISLGLVLPALGALLAPGQREALLLVKPQFEVGRSRVGKGGVVRDPAAHVDAIEGVIRAAAGLGWQALGLVASPITGPAGNHEYLLWLGSSLAGDGTAAAGAGLASAGLATDAVGTLERATAGLETAESRDPVIQLVDNKTADIKKADNKTADNKSVEIQAAEIQVTEIKAAEIQAVDSKTVEINTAENKTTENKTTGGQETEAPAAPGADLPDPQASLTQAPEPTMGPKEPLASPTNPLQSPATQPQVGEPIRAGAGNKNQACLAGAGGLDRRAIRALVDQTLASH